MMTAEEVRAKVRAKVDELGGPGTAARKLNVSYVYLSEVLRGRFGPGVRLAKAVGFRRVIVYESIK